MSELTPQIAEQVQAACQANDGEVAGALSRALDAEIRLTVGKSDTAALGELPSGPGLAALFTFGEVGLVALIAEASGLLPDWYKQPDKTGQSKLSTLAQELSMLVVPDSLMADEFKAERVEDISAALKRAELAENATAIALELTAGDATATLQLIWPLTKARRFFNAAQTSSVGDSAAERMAQQRQHKPGSVAELPRYSRSLLKINVPVSVVLATKRESVHDVVELAPGTIIKFGKSCDEPLHLHIGDQRVAEGEAVKVGDKFGFRVTAMTLPVEHFLRVRPSRAS